ncbi:hypothetical protein FUAX_08830 [Fulvitalea axinellae]|uniref:Antitoxin component YwqK of the YwqJK toxin-antitoxin module n=1 Tax=Fulvitalea axinellae TaxID=1182444 RepID=A0AAU9C8K6_9BACT|nr:hypothetical protein FUAX_08830 [Fulvitalea axinellae]
MVLRILCATAFCLLVFSATASFGQVVEGIDLERYEPITLKVGADLLEKPEEGKKKKKKRKKKVFYGQKTKRSYVKKGFGASMQYEEFHYLKVPGGEVDAYVPDIYWFDARQRKIKRNKKVDKNHGYLLHGTYKRFKGDALVEEGIYFYGMKHGRWTTHSKKGILGDKRKYYKGWPKEARVTYYDQEMKKLKEVVPVRNKEVTGWYYRFFEDGKVAMQGRYHRGKRLGQWVEYYHSDRKRRKRVIEYDREIYGEKRPFIAKEWDSNGKTLYTSPKLKKR